MTNPKEEPRQMEKPNESSSESQPHEIPIINASPWRSRNEFYTQLEAATLESIRLKEQGELFRWNWVNIFGDKISIALENLPNDENIGPHALILMTQEEYTLGFEINTIGVNAYRGVKIGEEKEIPILDVGDDNQITTFIGICARALEVGIPPDGIIDAVSASSPRLNDYMSGPDKRRNHYDLKLRDFSRQLSERQFL